MPKTSTPSTTRLWTSGQLSPRDIERLPELGIEAVVNLALPTSSNALPGEAEAITALGLPYVQIPVPWERPEPQHLRQFFGVMDAFDGRKVWVHCAKNMRVSAFVYLYRRLRRGEPDDSGASPDGRRVGAERTWRAFIDAALRQHGDGSRTAVSASLRFAYDRSAARPAAVLERTAITFIALLKSTSRPPGGCATSPDALRCYSW